MREAVTLNLADSVDDVLLAALFDEDGTADHDAVEAARELVATWAGGRPGQAAAPGRGDAERSARPRPGRSFPTYPSSVRVVLNVIWLVLSGLWLALAYVAFGIVMCLLIITIPFGVAAFRLAAFAIWPFGRAVVPRPTAGAGSFIGNVLWFILCGFWMAVTHLVTGVVLCLTIIGIPLGLGNFKLIPIAVAPLGKEIIDIDDPYAFVASGSAYR